jgi:hypothetical protein
MFNRNVRCPLITLDAFLEFPLAPRSVPIVCDGACGAVERVVFRFVRGVVHVAHQGW